MRKKFLSLIVLCLTLCMLQIVPAMAAVSWGQNYGRSCEEAYTGSTITRSVTCEACKQKVSVSGKAVGTYGNTHSCKTATATITLTIYCGSHNWKTTKSATCTSTGSKICTICRKTATISKKAHTKGSAKIATKATCTRAGKKTVSCTKCGKLLKTYTIQKLGHKYSKGKCTRCGAKK